MEIKTFTHTLYRPRDNSVYGNYSNKEAAEKAATCALISEGLICKLVEHETPITQTWYTSQELADLREQGVAI